MTYSNKWHVVNYLKKNKVILFYKTIKLLDYKNNLSVFIAFLESELWHKTWNYRKHNKNSAKVFRCFDDNTVHFN